MVSRIFRLFFSFFFLFCFAYCCLSGFFLGLTLSVCFRLVNLNIPLVYFKSRVINCFRVCQYDKNCKISSHIYVWTAGIRHCNCLFKSKPCTNVTHYCLTSRLVIGPQILSLSDNLTLIVVSDQFQYQSNKAINRYSH